jgi:hypothetical protein
MHLRFMGHHHKKNTKIHGETRHVIEAMHECKLPPLLLKACLVDSGGSEPHVSPPKLIAQAKLCIHSAV